MPMVREYIVTQTTETVIRYGFPGNGTDRNEAALREAHKFMLNPTPSMTSSIVAHRIVEETVQEVKA